MWPEFWPFAGWRLAGAPQPQPEQAKALRRRYRRETGRDRVPAWAWTRLSYMKARPTIPVTQAPSVPWPFNGRGMFLLEPTGGTENVAAWKQAGGTYLLLNIAHTSGGTWTTHRQRAKACGLTVIPWRRVLTIDDVLDVELAADAWDSPAAAHNLEHEAVTTLTPARLLTVTSAFPRARVRAVITEPWMQNQAGWQHLGQAGWVAMPESFMNANPAFDPTVLCTHARDEGMPLAVPAFGWGQWADAPTYIPPAHYLARWRGPFTVYPGDSRELLYHEWSR
jgi:hypothetical protein